MALDFEKLSPYLRDILLNLKHMSPMRRFNELSRPRFELNWQTLAFRYGIEKLEAQGWIISDQEILNPAQKQTSPLINTDDTDQEIGSSGDRDIGSSENQNPDLPQRTQRTQSTESQAAEEDSELKQVQEEVDAGLKKMAEAAAMETERTPMPENQNDKEAVRRRDDEIWRRACEYTEHTLRPRIEAEIRRQVGAPMQWEPQEDRAEYHRRQLAKLTKADAAPRCEHIYTDGTTCGSPKLKNGHWCYAHERMKAVRVTRLRLLPMEDGNSIMLNLMEIQRALVEGEISERTAGLLMYNQQLALIGLKGITFRETDAGAMVTVLPRRTRRNRVIGRSGDRVIGKSKTHHGDAETRRKTLPLINADERGLQHESGKSGIQGNGRSGRGGRDGHSGHGRRGASRRPTATATATAEGASTPVRATSARPGDPGTSTPVRATSARPGDTGASTPVGATSARPGDPGGCATRFVRTGLVNPEVIPGDESAKSFRFGDGGDEGWGEGERKRSPESHPSRPKPGRPGTPVIAVIAKPKTFETRRKGVSGGQKIGSSV